jgi:uncharacterized membrane protein YedE/YeeE
MRGTAQPSIRCLVRMAPRLLPCPRMQTSGSIPAALAGGALIGASASLMLYCNGKLAGVSSILGNLVSGARGDGAHWRLWFVLGLIAGGAVMMLASPRAFSTAGLPGTAPLVVAGLLVGFGTRMGNGCTSGHGVCGISRLSARSIAATGVFIAAGIATVAALRVVGGSP